MIQYGKMINYILINKYMNYLTGRFGGPEVSYHQIYSARDWLSTLRTSYSTQNLQNPLEIIPLQTTRKKDNRKTEETLERVTVTLGTERIKGSNP